MVPLQQGINYLPEMNGSYFFKEVHPALVSEIGYEDLEKGDGASACFAFEENMNNPEVDIPLIRGNLLKYRGLDMLGMVKIKERLLVLNFK